MLGLRLRRGVADDDEHAGQHLQVIGVAAELGHAALDVGVVALAVGHGECAGEHDFGGFGGELAAGLRRAGLDDHRPALGGAGDVERAADGEILALVVQHVELRRVEEHTVGHIHGESVVGPAIP